MFIIKPLKVLVCLVILVVLAPVCPVWSYTGPDVSAPGLQGDALSAEPNAQSRSVIRQQFPGTTQSSPTTSSRGTSYTSSNYRRGGQVSAPVYTPPPTAPVCGPEGCPPGIGAPNTYQQQFLPPIFGMFSPSGLGFRGCDDGAILPHPGCKQFQLSARLWYAKMNASTQLWGTQPPGIPGTELDLNRDLDLSRYQYIGEYEARCQIRPNWGIHFSFMPINYRDNSNPANGFYWGYYPYPAFAPTLTKWDRYIYRWDLVYDWFHQKHAVSSVFAGYALYDDNLTISNNAFGSTRSRSKQLNLAYAGASIERVIRDIGQATVSAECKWSVQFLDDYLGWDGQAVGRVYIPMNYGRYGYLEAGWRWIVLDRSYPANIDKTSLDGVTGAVGLIF